MGSLVDYKSLGVYSNIPQSIHLAFQTNTSRNCRIEITENVPYGNYKAFGYQI